MQKAQIDILITIVSASLFILLIVVAAFLFFRIYSKKKNKLMIEQERLKNYYEQAILRTQIEIQEQTLKNISQEIHDNIGQSLSLAKLNLNTLDINNANAPEKISNTREMVSKAIHDLRDLSRSLHTDSILSAGLVKAIELELFMIEKAGVHQTELVVSGSPVKIDPKKELILFRIIQESVNNIIKHADASSIKVEISFNLHFLVIKVKDNGNGMHQKSVDGSGLRNMKNRAELIEASLVIESGDSGTSIIIHLPIKEA